MLKKLKRVMGILLILCAVLGLGFWEMRGRNMVLADQVIVASREICPGTVITSEDITIRSVIEDDLISGAALPDKYDLLLGRTAASYIAQNSQISESMLLDRGALIVDKDASIYTIKGDWIAMKSSSLRRGDCVTVYGGSSMLPVGTYTVAFVKDNTGREVTNTENLYYDIPLNRAESTSVIDSVEIICKLDDYDRIIDTVNNEADGKLLLVQEVGI